MAVLEIRVLGPFEVHREPAGTPVFESLKTRALLIYLAVESNKPHSRESLAGMFWPERPDAASLANLRHTLASLRTTLGERSQETGQTASPLFTVTSTTIQLNRNSSIWVDLCEFEQGLTASDLALHQETQVPLDRLNRVVDLYRGPFLEGFSLKGCPEFEDWMLLRRENAALKMQKALTTLADAYQDAGDLEQALSALRRLLKIEPWDENTHRKVMALLAASSQRGAALAQYQRCCQVLREELGVEPELETVRLYEQIRQGAYSGAAFHPTDRHAARTPPDLGRAARFQKLQASSFVGRAQELARLHRSLKLAMGGQGQLVLISGEAGSGKTSLAWEFARQALLQNGDLLVASGRCNAITGLEDSYLPFREILHMLVSGNQTPPAGPLVPEHLRRLTEAFPETIKSLVAAGPELVGSFIPREILQQRADTFGPGIHPWQREYEQLLVQTAAQLRPGPGAAGAQGLNEPLTRVLLDLARRRPLVLFVDDLHWADAGSVNMLHHLCKRLADSRVMIVGAYRPQDTLASHRQVDQSWERHPFEVVRLELGRLFGEIEMQLDTTGSMDFLDNLVDLQPNSLGPDFRHTLYRHTNANPLFTLELLRSMQERGDLVQNADGRWVEGALLDWEKLPARVEAVIADRIGRLPPALQSVLRTASVEGEIFTAQVAARVLEQDAHLVVSWLSGPLGREQQLVRGLDVDWGSSGTGGAPGRLSHYRFKHILFQKYLYNQLDPVERSSLHEAVGLALENLYGASADHKALQMAWHFEQAGMAGKAAEYLFKAGKQAIRLSAHHQANSLYDRSLGLLVHMPDSPERARFELHLQLARVAALFVTDGWGSSQAVQAVNRALDLWQASGANHADPSLMLALYFQADHFNAQNNIPEALARVERLLDLVSAGAEQPYKVLAYKQAGHVFLFAGQPTRAVECLETAISLHRPQDDPFLTEVDGYNVLHAAMTWNGIAHWLLGNFRTARRCTQLAIESARRLENPYYLANTLAVAGATFYTLQNEPDLACAYAQEALQVADAGQIQLAQILSKTVLGWVQVRQGQEMSGLDLLRSSIFEWKATGSRTLMPLGLMLMADAMSQAGQTQAAWDITRALVEMVSQSGRQVLEANMHWLQGEIAARELRRPGSVWVPGCPPEVCFEKAIEVASHQQAQALVLRAATSLARFLSEKGKAAAALSCLEPVLGRFEFEIETSDLKDARDLLAGLKSAAG